MKKLSKSQRAYNMYFVFIKHIVIFYDYIIPKNKTFNNEIDRIIITFQK